MSAIRGVLLDVDGTLIDSNELHVAAWEEVFAEAGYGVNRQVLRGQIGKGGDNLVPFLLPEAPAAVQKRLADRHGEVFKERYIDQAKPFPGAHDLLVRMAEAGLRLVLATSAGQEELDHHLASLDARDLIEASVTIDEVARSKPAPDIFAAALAKLPPLHARELLALGDSPFDIAAAGQSGIGTVALLSGNFSAEELDGAVALYRDVSELLEKWGDSPFAMIRP